MPENFPVELVLGYAVKVAGAALFLIAAWIVASWLRRFIRNRLEQTDFDVTLGRLLANLVRIAVLVLAFAAALGIFGVEMTAFAALLAGAGLAIGLAMQGTLSNIGAGAMLLTFRPFKVGDYAKFADVEGFVDEIGLFTTMLNTRDNRRIIVPNRTIFDSTIENVTYHLRRRVDVAVGTDYGADLDETRRVLNEAAASVKGRLENPAPSVYLGELGASSIDWSVRVWAKPADYMAVRERLTYAVKTHLDRAGIGIPFPQRDVHLDRVDS